jgi:folate-dependent phosphoribosylglycinamide formyltransferase PurN
MSGTDDFRIAVLTRRWTWYGELVIHLLAQRGVRPKLILVENTPMRARLVLARRLARRIGWIDAIRYNIGFWRPVLGRLLGITRQAKFPYQHYADRVIEANDINAPAMAQALEEEGIDRVLLAHSGLIRKPILDTGGIWIINAHPGALPSMRGVDVVRWAILEGRMPAISVHVVDSGVDTGPVLKCESIAPLPDESLPEFERRVSETAAQRLVECTLAGPGAFTQPRRQNREDGRQYYLMPFNLLPRVAENFSAMKKERAPHDTI